MKTKSLIFFSATRHHLILPLAAALALTGGAHAATLEWDPGITGGTAQGGTGTWNVVAPNVWWNGSINTTWTDSSANDAVFAGTAGAVTLGGNRTAGSVQFNTAGYTLFFGNATSSSAIRQLALTSLGGSALSNTTFIASQTLTTGTSNIIFNHGANEFTFAGIVADNGLGNKSAIYLQSTGRFILGAGTNYTATAQLTMASSGPLQLATTSGLPSNYEHAAASNSTVELAAGDFSKVFVTAFVGTNDFRTRGGNLGFAAIGADRTVTMANTTDVTWGTSNNLNVGVLTLGAAASTGKLTLTHADTSKFLRLQNSTAGTVTREIRTDNGSAAIDAEIAVKLADGATAGRLGAINKTGDGVLALTAANTYTGPTTVTGGTLALIGGSQASAITVQSGAKLGFDINSSTTSTAAVTLDPGHGIEVSGTPTLASYTLLTTTATITGTPVLSPAISGYTLVVDGDNTLKLNSTGGNTAPTISAIADLAVPSGGNTGALAFTVGDNETAAASLTLSGASSNTTLVPNGNITFGGSGANRTVTVTPVAGLTGSATITVTVTDAGSLTADESFVLTVNANYVSWAAGQGIAGEPAGGDYDNDGLNNLAEYSLGKDPKVSSQPAGVLSGNTITFTKGADAIANGDVSWVIETSETLNNDWAPAVSQIAGNTDPTISYLFTPGTPAKKFARLKVTKTN